MGTYEAPPFFLRGIWVQTDVPLDKALSYPSSPQGTPALANDPGIHMQLTKTRLSCPTEGFSLTDICWHQNPLREKGRSPGGGLSTLSGAPHGTWDLGQGKRDPASVVELEQRVPEGGNLLHCPARSGHTSASTLTPTSGGQFYTQSTRYPLVYKTPLYKCENQSAGRQSHTAQRTNPCSA